MVLSRRIDESVRGVQDLWEIRRMGRARLGLLEVSMGIIGRLWQSLESQRIGFRIDESMSGRHEFEPGMGPKGAHPFRFDVRSGPDDIVPWLRPGGPDFMVQPMTGIASSAYTGRLFSYDEESPFEHPGSIDRFFGLARAGVSRP